MDSLIVELPEDLRQFLEVEASERGLETAEAALVALARREQRRRAEAHLEALLVEGLESGPAVPITPDFWADIRLEVRERLASERHLP